MNYCLFGKQLKKRQNKFSKETAEGIFIRYKVDSGLAWGEGHLVMDATTTKNAAGNLKCHACCVKDVFAPDDSPSPPKMGHGNQKCKV